MKSLFTYLTTSVVLAVCQPAFAAFLGPIEPTDTIQVKFRVLDYARLGTPGDLLYAEYAVTYPGYNGSVTAKLYDGDLLLGTHIHTDFSDLNPNIFKKAGSQFTYENPTVVDFTKIDNSTIDGRVDFTFSNPLFTFNSDWIRMGVYESVNAASRTVDINGGGPTVEILSVTKVPEPSTFAMFAATALTVILCIRRRYDI